MLLYEAGGDTMRTKLRDARRRAGLTQSDIALTLGVSRSYYSQIECGAKNPSYRLFESTEEPRVPGNPYIREFGRKTLAER